MSNFIKPINSSSKKIGDNTLEYSGYYMQDIYSPYDGVVSRTSPSECGGKIVIKHDFEGSTVYSNFCNTPTILTNRGDRVRSGNVIGRLGSNPLEFSISDGSTNLRTSSFFNGSNSPDVNREKENNSKIKNTPNYKDKTNDFGSYKRQDTLTIGHQVMADALSLPLKIFKGEHLFKWSPKIANKSENYDLKSKLIEEIINIKKLIKY